MCYPNGGDEPTITDANLVLGPHPAGADRRRHRARCRARARAASRRSAQRLAGNMSAEQLAEGIIEIANWNQANCHPPDDHPARHRSARLRAAVVRRRRPGAIAGGDGAARHEGLHRAAQSRATSRRSGCWRSTGAPTTSSPRSCTRTRSTSPRSRTSTPALEARGGRDAGARRHRARRASGSCARPTCATPASRWKCACRRRRGAIDARFLDGADRRLPRRASQAPSATTIAGQQKIEIVNFCVSGFGMIERPSIAEARASARHARAASAQRGRSISTAPSATRRSTTAPRCRRAARLEGPAVVEEFGSTTVVFPGPACSTVDPHGILIIRPARRAAEAAR